MNDTRWFISYRYDTHDFLTKRKYDTKFGQLVIDISPANWILKHSNNFGILYAEKISAALASELIHGGAGVSAEYLRED